ncbi:MAG: DUF1592 domain-containing protein [Polyangiales bacterium]
MRNAIGAGSLFLLSFLGCDGLIGAPMEDPSLMPICDPSDTECVEPARCEDSSATTALEHQPIRRLSETEYHNTMQDLFEGVEYTPTDLVPVLTDAGFENFVSNTRQVGERDLEAFDASISGIAARASTNEAFLARHGCAAGAPQGECIEGFVREFGRRAFRRPLTDAEQTDYRNLVAEITTEIDLAGGIETMIASALMSPEFLYRVESRGESQASSYAIASRISYLLWQSMPDDVLFDAAASGQLASADQLAAQARRMLDDPRATNSIVDFHRQWLRFSRMDESKYAAKSPTLFPEWTPALRTAVQEEVRRFVEHVAEDDATLASLYTDRTAFVNAELAELYGLPAVDGWTEVELPADERSGILTRANFLAGTGIAGHGSPVHRGIFVYESLLCNHLGGVPDDADTSVPEEAPDDQTTRELYEEITAAPSCRGCHARVNPIGFTFENYTSTGAYRTREHGRDIDATGALAGSDQADPVDNALELSENLALSEVAHACTADKWTTYMLGRRLDESVQDDVCFAERIQQTFLSSGGDMRELLVTLVTQPEFVGGAQ